ncbi:pyruvate kinase [Methylocystis parvus]|uniref:Pyruvate kinase n=1 Tax=Methylocystis parvus TaxID=134 RepID=A0A6B8M339_9HYPH|nr:pyruvate kinase [Methylocystis parvus]QGM96755.1 pyruvate kinase [Methylocystis parvus]WBJ99369.1 pyruvate kinase [Methylocystis parvus OBBP]
MRGCGKTYDAKKELVALKDEVASLRAAVISEGEARLVDWGLAAPGEDGARNLALYLSLRSRDLSALQLRLAAFGLSSLGRSEADVLTSLDALLATLRRLCGEKADYPMREADDPLKRACDAVFGPAAERRTRIMATLPSEAADDPTLVSALIAAGMDCARINCAHDEARAWRRMAGHVRAAAERQGRACRILMDIGGPKLRIEAVRGPEKCRLGAGDRLILTERLDPRGKGVVASLNFPEAVKELKLGMEISFDDGKAAGRVVARGDAGVEVEILSARAKGLRLKPGKGVNLPTVELGLSPLTEKDLADLDSVAELADLVGFSFVQRVEDISLLEAELAARRGDRPPPGLVLKIETPLAVRNLPRLIVRAAARQPTAVMIARGDLAVEVGFARLSEMQEEVLWLCEAAHTPAIWATQVLDQLVHEGVASRAETTDAAMAQRADCVMLNKGAYLPQGVRFLRDVLDRMDRHQWKKFARLSRLKAWS